MDHLQAGLEGSFAVVPEPSACRIDRKRPFLRACPVWYWLCARFGRRCSPLGSLSFFFGEVLASFSSCYSVHDSRFRFGFYGPDKT